MQNSIQPDYIVRDSSTELYLKSSIQTASTIVINHVASIADANSEHISLSTTYKHLRGQYTNDDPPIILDSYDDVGSFTLTRDNLIDRPKTRQQLTESLAKELTAKYPKQYLLIMGILNPIATSVTYEDGKIFPTNITGIEPQETTLLDRLQGYVDAFKNKYDLNMYSLTDPYFNHAYLAMLHYAIVIFILNIRIETIHTEEAHSFHVKNHLVSNGLAVKDIRLIPFVTKMRLYKNIGYIGSEIGKQITFLRTLGWLSDDTDVAFTGYQPVLGNDSDDNIVTGFTPVPLINSSRDILSVPEYENATEEIHNLTEDLLSEQSPSVGYTKVILASSKATQVGSLVNINDFAFYMLIHLVQTGKYSGKVVSHILDTMDIKMVTSTLMAGLLHNIGISDYLSCVITLPVIYKENSLDGGYLEKVRDQLSLELDKYHDALDVLILEDIKTPAIPSPSEFIDYIIERYTTLTRLQAHVSVQPDNIRVILQHVLDKMYPPAYNVKLYARGVEYDDILGTEDFTMKDYMILFKTLTTFDYTHSMGPWLDSVVNIANSLTTYSTRFIVDNNKQYADMVLEPLEIMSVTVTH